MAKKNPASPAASPATAVTLEDGRYALEGPVAAAMDRLPFPDPGLTLGQARQLAKGRMAAHRKLATQVKAVTGTARPRRARG